MALSSYTEKMCHAAAPCYKELFIFAAGFLDCEHAVLGLARTGLIFTGLQEGTQPGGGG